ncbi:MAG: GNAT family N-acetyltransferase [Lachnospiraceae bacterium]|nr:GNAT family N-acetyltransferase [Lachnospiraceae bacterium]
MNTSPELFYLPVDDTDPVLLTRLSRLATGIIREYYDPLLGKTQNDYMIKRFQSEEGIRNQLSHGYRYYIVQDLSESAAGETGDAARENGAADEAADLGFFSWTVRKDELYLSKFYLKADCRGKGVGRRIVDFLAEEAKKEGLRCISLNVNKYNESVTIYRKLGFHVAYAEVNDIGSGFVMDDFVMEKPVRPEEEPASDASVMSPQALLSILHTAEGLKCRTRHCDTTSGRRESVAEHSWRLSLFAMLVCPALAAEFPALDRDRVIRMCLIHDLGEVFTGDIPTFLKTEADAGSEDSLLNAWIAGFPAVIREEWENLLAEMQALKTPESRVYKALDKLEALIQHNESDISGWLPLEYDLQRNYAWNEVAFSSYLTKLREQVLYDTIDKIEEAGK